MGTHFNHPGKDTRTPEQKKADLPTPNILTAKDEHKNCWRLDREERVQLGDVRYCKHGKIQVIIHVHGLCQWSTLHPVWDFSKYRKAVLALG